MYRFLLRPSWIGLFVAGIAVAVGCIALGQWQLDRLHERTDRNAAVESAQAAPPVPAAVLLSTDHPVDAAAQWRRVTATGRYDAAHEVLLRGQLDGGRAGFHVLTPLITDDGTALLVNRGWIPIDPSGAATAAPSVPPAPDGEISVLGRVRPLEAVRAARAVATGDSLTLQTVDLPALADDVPYPLYSAYVELLEQQPSGQDQPELVDAPELSEGPHLAYAVQWFLFSGLGLLGYVMFARQEAQRRSSVPQPQSSPDDGAPPVGSAEFAGRAGAESAMTD